MGFVDVGIPQSWLWAQSSTVRAGPWVLRGADEVDEPLEPPIGPVARRTVLQPELSTELPSLVRLRGCRKPPAFSHLDSEGRLHVNCSSGGQWAAWPDHAAPGGGFFWQALPAKPLAPWAVGAEVIVTECGGELNWLSQIVPRQHALRRGKRVRPRHAHRGRASAGAPSVIVLFVGSVSRTRFVTQFPRTTQLLRRLNRSSTSALYNYPLYHALPCCSKNWLYGALAGTYNPTRAGERSPTRAAAAPWVWRDYERAGYVTHISSGWLQCSNRGT